jgi:hypothetical protein
MAGAYINMKVTGYFPSSRTMYGDWYLCPVLLYLSQLYGDWYLCPVLLYLSKLYGDWYLCPVLLPLPAVW